MKSSAVKIVKSTMGKGNSKPKTLEGSNSAIRKISNYC